MSFYIKVILYVSRLRFPKYPNYFFLFFMYIVYKTICKRKATFTVTTIPDSLLIALLNRQGRFPNHDPNNCVIISKLYCQQVGLSRYAKLNSKPPRLVQIFELNAAPYNQIIIGETLRYNLHFEEKLNVSKVNLETLKVASDVELCLIKSHEDISNSILDAVLGNYFATPKILYRNDTVTINMKQYGAEFFFANVKVNAVENLYFKCTKIKCGGQDSSERCFCVCGESTLKQSSNVQEYLVPREMRVCMYEVGDFQSFEDILIDCCPYGLSKYFQSLEKSVKPFMKEKNLPLIPAFLLQGPKGVGKNIVVASLAQKLGVHLYRISGGDVATQAYAQTEIKLKNVFFKAKLCSPCFVVINNFENFCKSNEGQFDQRIIAFFKNELNVLFKNNPFPIILLCLSNTKDLPADVGRIFLEVFKFDAPTQTERAEILRWLVKSKNLKSNADLDDVSRKSHGFLLGDLDALVYYARRNCFNERESLEGVDFQTGLDILQSSYMDSLGAPKVPRVQWSDVGGLTDVKHEIIRTINLPLKHPELLKTSGLKRSGVLLYGPPGTGKTLIAKAVATECGLCFLSVKGPELLNMYVGQSEQNVREVFERARQAAPCIIFFDELDSLAPNRGMSGDSGGVMDRVVSQLLSEMDGLNETATIFVIGATNRPDLIDPALLRPGRFDKMLYVGPAEDRESKISVLKALTKRFQLSEDVSFDEIVSSCPSNISGADFYGICSSAWMSAARKLIVKIEGGEVNYDELTEKGVVVNMEDFNEAIKSVKPSISVEDMLYFEKLKNELSVKK